VARFAGHHRSLRSWVAIVLLVAGWGVPLVFPHAGEDDLLCIVGGPAGENAPARVDASGNPAPPEHCVICHAARAFGADLAGRKPVASDVLRGRAVATPPHPAVARTYFGPLPARAPPVA
jgi:hypothetical protein